MSFGDKARVGPVQKVLFSGVSVTFALGLAATVVLSGTSEQSGDEAMAHDHAAEHPPAVAEQNADDSADSAPSEVDPHAHHRQMMQQKDYSRSLHSYQIPDTALVDMAGAQTSLLSEIDQGQPVMLNFIFTTCTTICPVLSATFSQVEQLLGDEREQVRMISITIDPEHDTPERLRTYAARYDVGPQWQFLTGKLDNIVATQKAFDAYRGTKMNHEPLTFIRASEQGPWVRLDGLASGADVVKEYRQLLADQASAP